MKISKSKIAACESVQVVDTVESEPVVSECKYDAALGLIRAAIESLAEIADGDELAKDSIANLGVVMLDLKGEC